MTAQQTTIDCLPESNRLAQFQRPGYDSPKKVWNPTESKTSGRFFTSCGVFGPVLFLISKGPHEVRLLVAMPAQTVTDMIALRLRHVHRKRPASTGSIGVWWTRTTTFAQVLTVLSGPCAMLSRANPHSHFSLLSPVTTDFRSGESDALFGLAYQAGASLVLRSTIFGSAPAPE